MPELEPYHKTLAPSLPLHAGPVLYSHWADAPWDNQRWPDFKPYELACPMTGHLYYSEYDLDIIQDARFQVNHPFKINSAHRSPIHNALVGGKPLSEHKKIAFDISILNHESPAEVFQACLDSGFTGFGFYQTFIHVDTGRPRSWATRLGRKKWKSLGIL